MSQAVTRREAGRRNPAARVPAMPQSAVTCRLLHLLQRLLLLLQLLELHLSTEGRRRSRSRVSLNQRAAWCEGGEEQQDGALLLTKLQLMMAALSALSVSTCLSISSLISSTAASLGSTMPRMTALSLRCMARLWQTTTEQERAGRAGESRASRASSGEQSSRLRQSPLLSALLCRSHRR